MVQPALWALHTTLKFEDIDSLLFAIFLDLTKGYATFDHSIVLVKLNCYSIWYWNENCW